MEMTAARGAETTHALLIGVSKAQLPSLQRLTQVDSRECTIEGMSNSDSFNDESSEFAVTPATRTQALNRIREAENERLGVERSVQKRLMWLGIVVGATVGMLVGYLATLITIVDNGIGEFGFEFYRPNFVQGFLRVITAYVLGGGLVGGAIMYTLFTNRREATSVLRWLIAAVAFGILALLVIGFLLPLTILIFGDFIEGLRPGLWLSAFVETLLGSFLDGYIFMLKSLYAGVAGGILFVAVNAAIYGASLNMPVPSALGRRVPETAVYYIVAAIIALIPLALLVIGPFSLATAVTSFLTGEKL